MPSVFLHRVLQCTFLGSLIPAADIIPAVREALRTSLLPELKDDAVRFHNLLGRGLAEESPPLIYLRVPEQSVMLIDPVNPRHQLLTIPIKLSDFSFDAFCKSTRASE
jgi:hypothetical protein